MTAPSNAPTREIGYAQASIASASTSSTNWWAFDDESTPELRWPQSVYVYDQMRRTDAQVASVLRAVSLPVRRTPWRIDPAGARAEVVQLVAEDLGLPIVGKPVEPLPRARDRFSWLEHLREALLMLPFGHMYFEQNVRIVEGKARLRKLAPRMPKTIEEIEVARDGGLVHIKQYSVDSVSQDPIPVSRLVAYIHDREAGNWLGSSLLRPAYKHWLLKDRLLRVQAQTIERNGMGIPTYTAAETEKSTDAGLGLATSLRAGEAAGAALPFGATLRLLGVEGTLPDAQPAIDYHDSQIARAVLAHFLNLGTQTGSWALGTTFADFFTLSLQTLAQQIADIATQHVVEDIVDWNWGEDEPAPKIVFDEIGSRQAATAEAIKSLIDAGVITPDEVLEGAVRQQFGLPAKDPNADPVPVQPAEAPVEASGAGPKAVTAHLPGKHPQDRHGNDVGVDVIPGDKLKLAGRIDLAPGEKLLSSQRIRSSDPDSWDLLAAEVDTPGGRQVRLGIIAEPKHWTVGTNSRPARIAELGKQVAELADRENLSEDEESLLDELDTELTDLRFTERLGADRTAILSPQDVGRMRADLEAAVERARKHTRDSNAFFNSSAADQLREPDAESLPRIQEIRMTPSNQRTDEERRFLAEFDGPDQEQLFVHGSVPAGPDGDLHYEVEGIEDGESGWEIRFGIKPPGAGDNWQIGSIADDKAFFPPRNANGLLKALGELESGDQPKSSSTRDVQASARSFRRASARMSQRNRPRPRTPKPVTAHTPGGHQHNQQSHAGVDLPGPLRGARVFSAAEYADEYGDVVDDWSLELNADGMLLTARFFDRGDAHLVIDLPDGRHQVIGEFDDSDAMRSLADSIREVQHEPIPDGPTTGDVVADHNSHEHPFYVAKDDYGDVWLRDDDADENDRLEIGEDQAWELFDALNDLADSYDAELGDEGDEDGEVQAAGWVQAHLPGLHPQDRHGRRYRIPGDRSSGLLPRKPASKKGRTSTLEGRTHETPVGRALRRAYGDVAGGSKGYVRLDEVRARLGDIPKDEVDRTLKQLAREKRIHLAPNDYQFNLTPEQRAGSVEFGGRTNHLIMFEDDADELEGLRQSLAKAKQRAEVFAKAAAKDATPEGKPTSTPTRMTSGQYTKILKDEHIRLQLLAGKSEKEAKAAARPKASIDDLKARNTALRKALRAKGIDHRTDEQKRADDAEKNALLDEVERLAVAGGHDGAAKRAGASKMSRTELRKFVSDVKDFQRRQKARKDAGSGEAFQAAEDASRATSRQVGYIKGLIRERAKSGGGPVPGPTETDEIRRLSNAEARAYINRLLRGGR